MVDEDVKLRVGIAQAANGVHDLPDLMILRMDGTSSEPATDKRIVMHLVLRGLIRSLGALEHVGRRAARARKVKLATPRLHGRWRGYSTASLGIS